MKVLYEELYEREGNDAWLIDKIQIVREDGELYLRHKWKWNGWNGEDKGTLEIELEESNLEAAQDRIEKYMKESVTSEMKIPNIVEIINEEKNV